ncbi:MAG: Lrp/AsnC family transcriptional regulator [Chloroflexi bacterium]|nr:Lrp/AsnC family transcriptional regulator [Chloroflexota bacterium]
MSTRVVPRDAIDGRLLNMVQESFPLEVAPYARLGEMLGIDEGEVLGRVQRLRDAHVIRQISAIFDTRALGYQSSLVAMQVDSARVDQAAAVVNTHPGVSHNYKRNHQFNMWFTIAVPPQSCLERIVQRLHQMAGATSTRILPTLRLFKIGVVLDVAGEEAVDERAAPAYTDEVRQRALARPLTDKDVAVIRELQDDLSMEPQPFGGMARRLGMSVEVLLGWGHRLMESGHMRRFAAILYHREAGFRANPMVVWAVPEERVAEVGNRMASFRAVSHCYQRPTYPDWPYNVFTMVHGRKVRECEQVVDAIQAATGMDRRAFLYSTKEYKKTRVRYFSPEFEEWERQNLAAEG